MCGNYSSEETIWGNTVFGDMRSSDSLSWFFSVAKSVNKSRVHWTLGEHDLPTCFDYHISLWLDWFTTHDYGFLKSWDYPFPIQTDFILLHFFLKVENEITILPHPHHQDHPRMNWKIFELQSVMYQTTARNQRNSLYWAQEQLNQITKVIEVKFFSNLITHT